jgi:hypothetical protein
MGSDVTADVWPHACHNRNSETLMHLWHPRDGLAVTDAADSHGSAEDALLLGRDALAHGAAR